MPAEQMRAGAAAGAVDGMAGALLREIATLLERLAAGGEPATIDLHAMPLSEAERGELEARLGHGEVAAELDIAGVSRVWETRYAGVWWVRHFGADERLAGEAIAIARVPRILMSHPADIAAASERLGAELAVGGGDDAG
jgi:hydrogenase-1 operon protein HyaF